MTGKRSGGRMVLLPLAVAFLAALVAAGCGGGSDNSSSGTTGGGGESTSMRIAIIPTFGSLPVEAAAEEGIFERNGIDATIVENPDIGSFPPALGRQYDVVMSTGVDFTTAAAKGIDIKAAANMFRVSEKEPNTPVVAPPEVGVKTAADLDGKRVGVVSLAGSTYVSLLYLLDRAGVSRDSVDFTAIPFPAMADQLKAGQVDATAATIPFFSQMLAEGDEVAFDPFVVAAEESTGQEEPAVAFLSASGAFAEDNPEAIDALRKSIEESIQWIEGNEPEARQLLEAWLELPSEVAEKAPLPIYDAKIDEEDLETWVEVTTAVNPELEPPAAKELLLP